MLKNLFAQIDTSNEQRTLHKHIIVSELQQNIEICIKDVSTVLFYSVTNLFHYYLFLMFVIHFAAIFWHI